MKNLRTLTLLLGLVLFALVSWGCGGNDTPSVPTGVGTPGPVASEDAPEDDTPEPINDPSP